MTRRGTARGAVGQRIENALPVATDKALSNNDLLNSRGGTRTRDPGIMSAVL